MDEAMDGRTALEVALKPFMDEYGLRAVWFPNTLRLEAVPPSNSVPCVATFEHDFWQCYADSNPDFKENVIANIVTQMTAPYRADAGGEFAQGPAITKSITGS